MAQKPIQACASAQCPISKILNPSKSKLKPGLLTNTGLYLHDRNDSDNDDDDDEGKDDGDRESIVDLVCDPGIGFHLILQSLLLSHFTVT